MLNHCKNNAIHCKINDICIAWTLTLCKNKRVFLYCPGGGVCYPPPEPLLPPSVVVRYCLYNRVQKPKRRLAAPRRLGPSKTPSKSSIIGTDTHTEHK